MNDSFEVLTWFQSIRIHFQWDELSTSSRNFVLSQARNYWLGKYVNRKRVLWAVSDPSGIPSRLRDYKFQKGLYSIRVNSLSAAGVHRTFSVVAPKKKSIFHTSRITPAYIQLLPVIVARNLHYVRQSANREDCRERKKTRSGTMTQYRVAWTLLVCSRELLRSQRNRNFSLREEAQYEDEVDTISIGEMKSSPRSISDVNLRGWSTNSISIVYASNFLPDVSDGELFERS